MSETEEADRRRRCAYRILDILDTDVANQDQWDTLIECIKDIEKNTARCIVNLLRRIEALDDWLEVKAEGAGND